MNFYFFRKSARNFNPTMLTAAKVGIVEVEEIVKLGEIDPDQVHLPGIYVDRILLGKDYQKRIEVFNLSGHGVYLFIYFYKLPLSEKNRIQGIHR